MRLRPHLGTLLFPPVALISLSNLQEWRPGANEFIICLCVTMIAFAFLAIMSWRFLRLYPTTGILFSACLTLMFPLTQAVREDLLEILFGSTSVIGLIGVIYFGVRGVRSQGPRGALEPHGFPVIPQATRMADIHGADDTPPGTFTPPRG